MKKNIKSIFLLTLLVLLLVGITCVNATDDISVNNTCDTTTQIDTTPSSEVQDNVISDNKEIQKTNVKSVKTDGNDNIDYYVSDNDGQDTNTGTQESPFKTIQTAIDKTTADKTYNIYIAEGTYKGLGNTNLTVNGNYTINFIGDDSSKTIFDGEAKYEINTEDYHWGSSDIWSFYTRESGNYFMTINSGNGQIKITDITIQNMYSPGGDRIYLYPHTTLDNYANLVVNNTRFLSNHGGVGSAIRNNNGATLTVENSYFENNTKSSSTGNDGIIYNNGTATIINSLFNHNYARWGTILNDKNIEVINTTLKDNIGYDGTSTYKYGTGIAFNTGNGDFNNLGFLLTNTNITGCTFINNDQTDIYGYAGNLIATNNHFINSTGIYIIDSNEYEDENKYQSYNLVYTIENNTFENMRVSTLLESMDITTTDEIKYTHAIYAKVISQLSISNNSIKSNNATLIEVNKATITDNTLNVENGIGIKLFGSDNQLENNVLNTKINLTSNNTVKFNTIITSDDYTVDIKGINNTVTNNKLYSAGLKGDQSVNNPGDNTVQDNESPFPENSIFVGQNVTSPAIGTLTNPTTMEDALSRLEDNGTIYLVKGTNTTFYRDTPIIINSSNVLVNTNTINIIGYDENITFNGNNMTQIFIIDPEFKVNIYNLTFTNANGRLGAAINNSGELNVENCVFTKNYASSGGASIRNIGTLTINGNNLFLDEESATMGGAIDNRNILVINGMNNFINCKSKRGGAIFSSGILNISGENNFINNTANPTSQRQGGGAIFSSSNLTIKGKNNFINNTATGSNNVYGGAIANYLSAGSTSPIPQIIIEGENTFLNNKVTATSNVAKGGAICVDFSGNIDQAEKGLFTISGNNKFINNTAESMYSGLGGSISGYYNMTIEGNNTFENSYASSSGGAINHIGFISLTGNNTFNNCSSIDGGVIYTNFIEVYGNKFINNNATNGAILSINPTANAAGKRNVIINDAKIINSTAENGGVIYINPTSTYTVITQLEITNNNFTNIKASNETLNIPHQIEATIANNNYNNCSIGFSEFTVSSIFEDQTIPQNTPIPVTINTQLTYPEYYDADILNKITYKAYVNDENKYEVENNQFTVQEAYTEENKGILNIYAKTEDNTQTNTITVNIIETLKTIFVGQNITTPDKGTLTNPTTIEDALSRLEDNGTIYLIKGTNTTFYRETPVYINSTNVLENTNTINIIGYDEDITFDGNNITQILNIASGYTVNIYNLTFTNANSRNGGAITNNASLTIENCIFTDNYGTQSGASIFNQGNLTINGNTVFNNEKSANMGGAIDNRNILTINGNNQFINCESKNGGAIYSFGILNIYGENNFINNTAKPTSQRQGGGAIFCSSNLTIKGKNNFINNTASGSTYVMGGAIANYLNGYGTFTVPYVVIEGENYFFNNKVTATSRQAFGGAVCVNFAGTIIPEIGDSYTLINGSNIFINNSAESTTSGSAGSLYSYYDLIIEGNNIFYNTFSTGLGGAIYNARTTTIKGNNLFENCSSISSDGGAIYSCFIELNGNKFINCNASNGGVFYISGFESKYGKSIVLINGTQIINASANVGGVINTEQMGYTEKIEITNNIFTNVLSNNETLNLFPPCEKIIKNNTYNNCSIGFSEFTVSSVFEDQTIPQNTPIPVTINTQLTYPEYYDTDILNKITYKAYVNDINKYEVENNQFTVQEAYTTENKGKLNIYAKTEDNTQTNTITINLIKPLNTTITPTAPTENTVNKTTPITIIFSDEEGNLVKDAQIKVTSSSVDETVTLPNGVLVYQYTPTIVGEETITFTYAGNSTLNPTETNLTLTVTQDKDKIIEELNNTIHEQESIINTLNDTITELNNTVQEQSTTISDLNDTVQKQNSTIGNLTNTIEEQAGTISSLNDTVNDLNSTVQQQADTINTLNDTVHEQTGTIESLNNTVQEQASTINSLNETVNDLNSTVQEQAGTINDLNNTVQEQTGTIENLNNTVQEQAGIINSLNDTVNDLNSTVQEQASTISDLNNTIQTQNSTIEDLQEQIDELKAPKNTTITFDKITDAKYNGNVTISGSLVNDESIGLFNQVVTLTIGDEEVNVTTKGGVFEYTTLFKELGEKTVTAKYAGSDKYLASNATTTFNVEKQDVIVTVDAISDIAYGENVSITGKFTQADGNKISNSNVKILINGKKYYARTDSNGVYVLSVKVTSVGVNNLTVGYSGNTNYNSYETDTTFNVVKQDVVVTFETIQDTIKGDNVTITGTFKDANGNAIGNSNVKIFINGKKYYARTDSNGVYVLSVQVTAVGVNNVSIGYSGNDNYNSYETNTTFNVDKQNVTVTCDPIADVDEGDNVTITGTFKDSNGKAIANSNVKIIVNGKKYYARTDSTGAYEFTTTANIVGVNNVTVGYSGNTNYNAYETTTTFNVIAKND